LFYRAVTSWTTYRRKIGQKSDELGKDLEGGGRGLTEVLSRHLPEMSEENHDKSQYIRPAEIQTENLPNTKLEAILAKINYISINIYRTVMTFKVEKCG
jgi:hypothetical protein